MQPLGGLSIIAHALEFPPLQVTGSDAVAAAPAAWVAGNESGADTGWRVTLIVSDFVDSRGNVIPASSLQVQILADDVRTLRGSGGAVSAVQQLTAASPNGITILSAAPGSSMGVFEFRPRFVLFAPAGAAPGDYNASVEVAILAGP